MPVLVDFFAIGMVALAAIVLVKTVVMSTPLKQLPGLGTFVGVA